MLVLEVLLTATLMNLTRREIELKGVKATSAKTNEDFVRFIQVGYRTKNYRTKNVQKYFVLAMYRFLFYRKHF